MEAPLTLRGALPASRRRQG